MRVILAAALLCLAAGAASADTGSDLIQVCGQSASLCNSGFQSDELRAVLKDNGCLAADSGQAEMAVVAWLGKHPKTARLEVNNAVARASRELWPCKITKRVKIKRAASRLPFFHSRKRAVSLIGGGERRGSRTARRGYARGTNPRRRPAWRWPRQH
jgi:hypothetical protein